MKEWKQDKLIDLLDSLIDYRGKTPRKVDKGIPLITAKIVKNGRIDTPTEFIDIKDYNSWMVRGFPKNGDVILTTEAPLGEVAQLDDKKIALAQRIVCLRGKEGVLDNTFLKYFLLSSLGQARLKARETGTTVTGIKQSELKEVLIDYPPYKYQKQITSILKSLDDKIELNRRINENLEQQAQALFKSWFVDFEPFKDGKFVNSELGMIPEGWRVGTIGDYCKIRSGFAFKSSWWTEKGVKIVKIKNISSSGILNMDDCSYVSKENVSKAKEFSLKPGDILIAMTGATIGKFCLVPALKEEMYVNQRVGKFFLGENPIMKIPFIHGLLKCENIISQIINKGQGSAQPNISGNDIETIPIIYPPEDIISKYNELVSPYFSMIIENISACDFISQLRDTLLPRLMSCELVITDVDDRSIFQ